MNRTFTLPRGVHIAPFTPTADDDTRRDLSIAEAYRRGAQCRSARIMAVALDGNDPRSKRNDARVFGEAKSRLWNGEMGTKLVRRESELLKRGTCPDKY